jgi:hypothetical protein
MLLTSGVLVAAASTLSGPAAAPGPVVPTAGVGRVAAGAAPLGSTAYPVPRSALHVAQTGSDDSPGTSRAPLRTIGAAIRRSADGGTIVVHAGAYHEGIVIPRGKRVTVQPYPRARVWLDGSSPVTGWSLAGGAFASSGWTAEFDSSPTYHWGAPDGDEEGWTFVNPAYPMAAHPDQVWIDGRAQRQVASRDELSRGTFYVDYPADRLYLGSDPRGRRVRASSIAKAVSIRGAGSVVRGIGVRRFAPSVPHMGAVTVEDDRIQLEDVVVADNATTGLHVVGAGAVLRGVTLARNGMLGASATYADGLRVARMLSAGNNTEHFNTSPVAGGMKVGRSRGVVVRSSVFRDNLGTGLWFDESVYDGRVLGTDLLRNRKHGLSLEISAKFVVADNLVAHNAGHGLKVNNTSRVAVWNNTFAGNGRPVNIVQDDRRAANREDPGHDPRQPFPDPTMTWVNGPVIVRDNIMAATRPSGNCLLCVEDYSGDLTAEQMRVTANGDVYQRPARHSPDWLVVWSRGAPNPAVYTSVADFADETGQESRRLELTGVAAVDARLRPTRRVARKASSVAVPLPASLARQLGRPAGARHLGAWF